MSSLIYSIVILTILCQFTYGVWNSNIYTEDVDDSSEEENIGFKSGNSQYYNSREAHGDIIGIDDEANVTGYHYYNSDEHSSEESSEETEHGIGTSSPYFMDEARLLPGLHDYPPATAMPLPLCNGRKKKGNKENKCEDEQNLCRSNGDCRISRIWGTCCESPGCGTYCQPNRSKCPHPNSIRASCDTSDQMCSPRGDDCPKGTNCCQVLPCGFRCV